MITKTIEYFVIVEENELFDSMEEREIFDTFEEARSHINDKNEDGTYKYHEPWNDYQGCWIYRHYADSTMKIISITNVWRFIHGRLSKEDSYCWDHEHAYTGKVW